jgi:hypothetical protein
MDALNHGEIVGTHHFPDTVTDHAAQNFSDLNHDLNSSYSSHVESISQGLDQHSHGFSNGPVNLENFNLASLIPFI